MRFEGAPKFSFFDSINGGKNPVQFLMEKVKSLNSKDEEIKVVIPRKPRPSFWKFELPDIPKGKPPGLVSELGLEAKKLLYKGYQNGHNLSLSGVTPFQTMFTSVLSMVDDFKLGMVTMTLAPAKGFLLELTGGLPMMLLGKASWNSKGPGLSGSFSSSFPNVESTKAELIFRHDHFVVQGATGLNPNFPLDLSLSLGGLAHDVTIGAEAGINPREGSISKLNAVVGLTQENISAAANFDVLGKRPLDIVLKQNLDPKLSVAAHLSLALNDTDAMVAYGIQYQPYPSLIVKGRWDDKGKVTGMVQHEFRTNSVISAQAEWDTKGNGEKKEPNLGFSISIMP